MLGAFQPANGTTAAAALALVQQAGVTLSLVAMREGRRSVQRPGRLEVLVCARGGSWRRHDGNSARKLLVGLRSLFHNWRLVVVLGDSVDHVSLLCWRRSKSGADRVIATRAPHPRAAKPVRIREPAADLGFDLEDSPSVPQAPEVALSEAGSDDLICCTDSAFVAAEPRTSWSARQGVGLPPSDPI